METLTFFLATYRLDGSFVGLLPLTSDLLDLCELDSRTNNNNNNNNQDDTQFLRFGAPYASECIVDLTDILSSFDETLFYDMCILFS